MIQRNETTIHGVDGWCTAHLDSDSGVHVYFPPFFFFVKISHEVTLGSCHHHYNAEFYSISIVHGDCMLSITKKSSMPRGRQ